MAYRSRAEAPLLLLLAAAWLATALLLAAAAGGGLAQRMLSLLALLPAGLCLAALLLRGGSREVRPAAAVAVGLLALALSLPLPALFGEPLLGKVREPGLFSGAALFALLAGFLSSCLYAALLLVRPARAAPLAGAAGLLAVSGVVLAVLGAPAGVQALPACGAPALLESSRFELTARGELDDRPIAVLHLAGERSGSSESWNGRRQGELVQHSRLEVVRLEGRSWLRVDEREWQATGATYAASQQPTIEGSLAATLAERQLAAAEDLAVELLGGVAVRHCRLMIDGTTAGRALPPLGWLLGGAALEGRPQLPIWRGELDWWIDESGALRRAELIVGGHPRDTWDVRGLRGRLRAELTLLEPAQPPPIDEPLR